LKLLYNDARGYYISAKREIDLESLSEKLKEDIIHISKRGRAITFSTQILASLNNRLKESEKILIFQSESALRKVIC
jgi:DNA mismatch repair ATPase MutS